MSFETQWLFAAYGRGKHDPVTRSHLKTRSDMRKTHSLKGRKVFYSVYENISETLVPPNMITRHTRACVTLQPTFLECGFSVLWPPGSAEEHPALFNTPPNSSLCSIRQPGTSLNPSLLALSNRTSVCVLNRFCKYC